jgi:glycosyl transferase family 28
MTPDRFESTALHRAQVDLIYFDAGGGHRASANALIAVAEQQKRPWSVRLLNLRDLLGPADMVRRYAGVKIEDFYNSQLKHGLTLGTGPLLRLTQMLIRRLEPAMIELLTSHWLQSQPDLVVSMIPNFNHAILQGLRRADAGQGRVETPMVTILTDMADYPPHFWIERQRQHLICGTAAAATQAIAMGHAPECVLRTSGMIVRPDFYRRTELDRGAERRLLGLDPELPTGIVMFGSYGSSQMTAIARRIASARLKTQLIFVCGHNDKLREQLETMKLGYPCYIVGFTQQVSRLMQLADFFIGKPGPGSISEALVMGLPLIVERNAWTMVQERFNTDWIAQNHLGIVLPSFREIASAIAAMLDPAQFSRLRANIAAIDNQAVFEIPEMLEGLIARHRMTSSRIGRASIASRISPQINASSDDRLFYRERL